MKDMITSRMRVGVWAVSIILVILLLQNALSDDISLGRLLSPQSKLNFSEEIINKMWLIIRMIVLVPLVVFWHWIGKSP
jgi:purine-cytosine permease-like protein